ncbi:MAG: 4-hydroxy-tetrahydrodipicolinate synthase [Gammaproteobacteria bacterium]
MFQGSIVALVTPMNEGGDLDLVAFDRLLDMHCDAGTSGVVIAGTTGESPCLSLVEVCRLTERAVDRVGAKLRVLAGCGTNSTGTSMSAARAVSTAGAHGVLVVTPYYNRPSQRGLVEHFQRVADAAQKPVVLYNVPGRTGCDLLPESVARLAVHPLIVAIKEATGSLERGEQIVAQCGDRLELLSGDDATFVDLMAVGAVGVISVTANVVPGPMAASCSAALANDFEQAVQFNLPLAALHRATMLQSNPMVVKWILAQLGLIDETLRLPMVPLESMYFDEVSAACEAAGLALTQAAQA